MGFGFKVRVGFGLGLGLVFGSLVFDKFSIVFSISVLSIIITPPVTLYRRID